MFKKLLSAFLVLLLLISPAFARDNKWGNTKPPIGAQIDYGHPLSQGLVGCWILNEGGGNIVGDIAQNNAGTNVGALWKASSKGSVLDFTPSQYVSILDKGRFTQAESTFTIISLVKFDDFTGNGNGYSPIFSKTNSGLPDPFDIYVQASKLKLFFGDGGGIQGTNYGYIFTSTIPSLSIWTHLAFVVKGGVAANNEIYIDAKKCVHSDDVNFTGSFLDSTQTANIGRRSDGATALNGQVAFTMYYNRVLSPSEIQQLYVEPYCFIKKTSWIKAGAAAVRRMFMVD